MTALERRIKHLEEENKKWRDAALASQNAHPGTLQKQATLLANTRFDNFLSAVDEHICCAICTMKMWHPYTLSCGHTFCRNCLQDWFSTALAQHMAAHPRYNPQATIPQHWRATLARPDLSLAARRHIEREIGMLLDALPQPTYSCPTCRVEVRNKPAENFVVKHLVRTVAGVQGESCPKEDPPTRLGQPVDGPWDGFFPVFRKD
ncbi:hypothetical protein BD414DRAFT_480613 [Trametes punicea]|nr:hypothetical protein BD414DRAFT_480613 [Trametes punicea]